jgi:hypothetical protein
MYLQILLILLIPAHWIPVTDSTAAEGLADPDTPTPVIS